MNLHEVSDRREQQLKTTPTKSFPLKVKESRSFETKSLVFPSMLQKTGALESTAVVLVWFEKAIGAVRGSLVVLGANDIERCYQV